jgi:hypothetical protein
MSRQQNMAGEGVDDEMQDRLPNLVSLLHWAGAWEGLAHWSKFDRTQQLIIGFLITEFI